MLNSSKMFSFICFLRLILGYSPIKQPTSTITTATSTSVAVQAEGQGGTEMELAGAGGGRGGDQDPLQQQHATLQSPPSLFFLSMLAVEWRRKYNISEILQR